MQSLKGEVVLRYKSITYIFDVNHKYRVLHAPSLSEDYTKQLRETYPPRCPP